MNQSVSLNISVAVNYKNNIPALARRLSLLVHCPVHQKLMNSILSQATYLGCGFKPQSGNIQEAIN